MRLRVWIKAAGHGAIARLARKTGLSQSYLSTLVNEKRVVRYHDTAKKISDATRGDVTIDELVTPTKKKRRRRKPTAAAVAAAA